MQIRPGLGAAVGALVTAWGVLGCSRTELDPPAPAAAQAPPLAVGGASPHGGAGTLAPSRTPSSGGHAIGEDSGDAGGTAGGGAVSDAGSGGDGGSFAGGAGGSFGGAAGSPEIVPPWRKVEGELPPSYAYALAAAPSVSGTVYAANYSGGGVYRTTTAGATWVSASRGLQDDAIRTLTVDPFDAAKVWAGTSSGVYFSDNFGDDWSAVDLGAPDYPEVMTIAIDPNSPGRVYVLVASPIQVTPYSGAAYRSLDGGHSWTKLGLPSPGWSVSITFDAADPDHLLVGTYRQSELESHDGGATFQAMPNLPDNTFQVVTGQTGGVLCSANFKGVARSLDGGATWLAGPTIPVNSLSVGPGPSFYATGTAGVYRSTDCADWTRVDAHQGYRTSIDASGAVYVAVAESGFQGVRRSPDGASEFVNVNAGLDNADILDLVVDPTAADALFVTASYRGVYHSLDAGQSFEQINGNVGHVGTSAFPSSLATDGHALFGFTYARLFHTSDLGASWSSSVLQPKPGVFPLILSVLFAPDSQQNVVYLGTSTGWATGVGFAVSVDGGDTFEARGDGAFNTKRMLWDKLHPGWIWALGWKPADYDPHAQSGALYLSKDTGLTWHAVSLPAPNHGVGLSAVITREGESLYVAVDGTGVLRSTDEGSNWSFMGRPPGQVFRAFEVDPFEPDTLYAATGPNLGLSSVGERGLYKSRDGGHSWRHADLGIIPGTVKTLVADPNRAGSLYAAMVNGGIYRTTTGGE